MSDQENTELEMLKSRARLMGVEFSNNIKVETLRARIEARLSESETGTDDIGDETDNDEAELNEQDPDAEPNALEMGAQSISTPAHTAAAATLVEPVNTGAAAAVAPKQTPMQKLRQEMYEEQMRLVRLRITNMDPKKADLPGEILTVANEYLGTVKKFVPYGEATEDGYHVPYCIYTMLNERKFLHISTGRDPRTGTPKVSTKWAKEFALEILPPLTESEIQQLAQAQIAAGSIITEEAF